MNEDTSSKRVNSPIINRTPGSTRIFNSLERERNTKEKPQCKTMHPSKSGHKGRQPDKSKGRDAKKEPQDQTQNPTKSRQRLSLKKGLYHKSCTCYTTQCFISNLHSFFRITPLKL